MADGGVYGFDYRTRTRDLGTPGRLLGPYFGPQGIPSLSSRDPESNPNPNTIQSKSESNPIRIQVQSNPGGSAIGPQSSILSPQSSILSPQSSILSPQSSIFKSDIEPGHVRHRAESCPTSSGTLTDDDWDP